MCDRKRERENIQNLQSSKGSHLINELHLAEGVSGNDGGSGLGMFVGNEIYKMEMCVCQT